MAILSHLVLRPYALAHRPAELPAAAACVLALVLVFIGDVTTPIQVVVSGLGLIPLLTAMWLFSTRVVLAVAAFAIGQLLVTGVLGTLSPVTVASEATAYVVLAIVCRLYAGSLASLFDGDPPNPDPPPRRMRGMAPAGTLTRRERQVARLAAQGYTAREIGNLLHIGKRTVETHLANAYDKLGVRSKRELMHAASLPALGETADA